MCTSTICMPRPLLALAVELGCLLEMMQVRFWKLLVKRLKSSSLELTEAMSVREGLRLAVGIQEKEIRLIKRSANHAADCFAKQAKVMMCLVDWRQYQASSLVGIWSSDALSVPPL
ncbi:hypothetical protein COLO4_03253 [Corchorus olitorius]|uniref:Uncharacterized protein n=1 Tax=Corchorus olitorius TaxID=93759 RepID=A0A1R3KZ65_9ROSI|nr:hypothetical protein COLO4_03253 [Corchorus olitorius]